MLRELSLNFNRPEPVNEEIQWTGGVLVTETTLDGIITKVDESFSEMSEYSPFEIVGKSHSIVRHPDMPKLIYKILWDTISSGSTFVGVIKNMAKSGKYYWSAVEITKGKDAFGNERYIAKRKNISRDVIKDTVEPLYESLLKLEKVGSDALSTRYFKNYLAKFGKDYMDFMVDILGDDAVQKEQYAKHEEVAQTPTSLDMLNVEVSDTIFHVEKEEKKVERKTFFEKLFS
ncbi:MAG: PAS domain-containing protein [Capnocytophaga sp.]|nr:PAS domain-containing protein [Capnocytophaga sp.]